MSFKTDAIDCYAEELMERVEEVHPDWSFEEQLKLRDKLLQQALGDERARQDAERMPS